MKKILPKIAVITFFIYVFVDFDSLFIAENVKNAGNAKTKIVSTIMLFLTKNKIGYYIVRALPLLIAIAYTIFVFKPKNKTKNDE